ncbi:UDP-N-acetyl glucosamine 2-epimerase [Cellulosimicrobium cellulans]|uniref:Uncharacterized protein n=1 Tax=Cellulosimicrobium cellulans TaxID=1710 RepID=A0A4Y4DY86_CELCE|nr:UDP-N-acetyl glucosamine 2-epimerase [Cellulosimicrobium cellulans]GED09673.1 hypothetical protein CCE02nite_16720 [Cellulosimicrobium cellulans]
MPAPWNYLRTVRSLAHRIVHIDETTSAAYTRSERHEAELAGLVREVARLSESLSRAEKDRAAREKVLTSALAEVRDSVHLVARRGTLERPTTRVVFLVHHIEAWDSYHELYRLMSEAPDFDPVVVSLPRDFADSGTLRDEDVVHRGLAERGVSHVRAAVENVDDVGRLVKTLAPDVIFRQSQWDEDIDPALSTPALSHARQCIVSYDTMNLVENVPAATTRNTAVDSELHRTAWLAFCANADMLEAARRDNLLGGARFRVVGHPKADQLRRAEPAWPVVGTSAGRPRVVWSSHHSIGDGWTRFGTFPAMAEDMLRWAESGEVEITWMPHPALVPYISTPRSPYRPEQLEDWLERWERLDNTAVFTSGYYAPLLAASDVMVTDGLSMLIEFQVFERPVVFVEREGHRPFTGIGEKVVAGTHRVGHAGAARACVESLLRDGDPLLGRQREIVAELFGAPGSAVRILEVLRDEIATERRSATARADVVPVQLG